VRIYIIPQHRIGNALVDRQLQQVDDFIGFLAEQMRSEDLPGFLIDHGLQKARGLPEDLRLGNGCCRQLKDLHLIAFVESFLFGHADA